MVDEQILSDDGFATERAVDISVVVPVSERVDDLAALYRQHAAELAKSGRSFEFVFVLDGPNDEARRTLKALREEHPQVRVLLLHRSFGEATALSVGFEGATAPVVMTLSSYFQVEPRELPKMLEQLDDDCDLAVSRRHPRLDGLFNRWQSGVFHWVVRMLTGTRYHDISCGLRVMKRKVADELSLYGDRHRFIPLLADERGFRVREVAVAQSPQDRKRRVFRPGVYLRRLLDTLTLFFLFKFTKKPLRFFGLVGSGLSAIGVAITGYLGVYRLLRLGAIADRPLLILGVLLMVLGIQLFSIGLLGEIIIFTHARRGKDYAVKGTEE